MARSRSTSGARPGPTPGPASRRSSKRTRKPQTRGIARREAIVDAAAKLFARHGFRGTGILGLAKEVGISHVGILHHFGSKEELLRATVERQDRHQASRVKHMRSLTGLEALRAIRQLSDEKLIDPLHARLFLVLIGENLDADDPLNAYFRDRAQDLRGFVAGAVRSGQDSGEIRGDADPEAVATEVIGFVAGISAQWALHPDSVDLDAGYRHYVERLVADLETAPR